MKRLFLILLLTFTIPSIHLTGQEKSTKEEKALEKERAKAKKDAIRKLKTLLTMTYRNWYWSGNIFKDEISEIYIINLISGEYFYFYMLPVADESNQGVQFMITFPESYLPNYGSKKNGEKTLKIEGRFEGGEKFTSTLYSTGNPREWYFRPNETKTIDGKPMSIQDSSFSSNKLHIRFQTNESSRYKGRYESVSFDISGAEEVCEAAKAILSLN